MTVVTDIPRAAWTSNIGPFTRRVWLQVRKGWVVLNYDATAPNDVTDGIRLYQHDEVGPIAFDMVDGSTITSMSFRLSDPGGTGAEVWYSEFPVAPS
jgi:hypothetical protein